MMRRLKRALFLIHRWFGVAMCVLIALWFASGIVMMYVEYPELTETERLTMLTPIPFEHVRLDPAAAAAELGTSPQALSSIRLSAIMGRPAYQFRRAGGPPGTVFADTGERLQGLTEEQAVQAARYSGFAAPDSQPQYLAMPEMDQWTVSAVLTPYRPLHKIALGDAAGTVVYVSDVTGEIVRDTTRRERFWNWLGSTIHWIYPWQLRRHVGLWTDVIVYLSLAGLVSIVTGALVGWLRLRIRRPYRGQSITPYRGMHRWHHLLGLGSVLFVATFMFSGLMSMAPWGVFANASSAAPAVARYTGGPVGDPAAYPAIDPGHPLGALKEIQWLRFGGEPYLLLSRSASDRQLLDGNRLLTAAERLARIERALPSLLPDAALAERVLLTGHDDYYYTHHNRYRPLPALRVIFHDPEQSWFHVDLRTGQIINRLTRTDRIARWLYNGLHSLDFAVLMQRRPLWDVVVIVLCLAGLAFSMTSIWIGWARLRKS